MLFATVNHGRQLPTPHARGSCPLCGAEVRAKCGEVLGWHWAHFSRADCDTWGEGESGWHRRWKHILAGPDPDSPHVEVALRLPGACLPNERHIDGTRHLGDVRHRADLLIRDVVIELQHSPISPAEIREREDFYGRAAARGMIWLFDGWRWSERIEVFPRERIRFRDPPHALAVCKAPVFIDLGYQGILRPYGDRRAETWSQRRFRLAYGVWREGDPRS